MAITCEACNGAGLAVPAVSLLAIVATLGVTAWSAGRGGLSRVRMLEAGLWGLAGAFWGGHLFVLLQHDPGSIVAAPSILVRVLDGGQSVIGAFFGVALFGSVILHFRRQPVLAHADACVPAVAIGYAAARVACLLNGDDFGTASNVPWAVQFPTGSEVYRVHLARGWIGPASALSLPVHPAQLYHALLGLAGVIALLRVRDVVPGTRLALALMMYGAGRFIIQFFRGDSAPIWGPLDVNHIAALVMLAAGIALWRWFASAHASRAASLAPVHER